MTSTDADTVADRSKQTTSVNDETPGHGRNVSDIVDVDRSKRLTKQERKKLKRETLRSRMAHTDEDKKMAREDNKDTASTTANSNNDVKNKKSKNKKKKKKMQSSSDHQQQDQIDKSLSTSTNESDKERVEEDEGRVLERCMKSYEPIDVPTKPSSNVLNNSNTSSKNKKNEHQQQQTETEEGGGRSLGKWFPSAVLVKCQAHYTNTGQMIVHNNSMARGVTLEQKDDPSEERQPKLPKASLALFYQYTDPKGHWSKQQLQLLMTFLQTIARHRNIGGRIRVAPEGVNATLSAVDDLTTTRQFGGRTAQETLRHVAADLKRFDPVFNLTDFKFIDDLSPDRHFKELKILPVQELVFYDIQSNEAPLVMDNNESHDQNVGKDDNNKPCRSSGRVVGGVHHLDAQEYHMMLQKENTVVIDVRNHYEAILGRFDGQMMLKKKKTSTSDEKKSGESTGLTDEDKSSNPADEAASVGGGCGGAEYIDPKMRKSTDFKEWLAKEETKEKIKGKTVMMFCTGGIRCERASVYLKSQLGDQVGQVYQLQGGIERYLKAFPDGGMWRGKNFVFDKREAVGVECPDGDGGVIRRKSKSNMKIDREGEDDSYTPKCCICGKPWDRYIGKKKCVTCGVPVLVCDSCLSTKPDKTAGMELKMRCPLCVEQNITVLASQIEFTDNGIHSKYRQDSSESADRTSTCKDKDVGETSSKAAGSVLKWGGGHAQAKKQRQKMKRTLCRFGSECIRKDCFFFHPERKTGASQESNKKTK